MTTPEVVGAHAPLATDLSRYAAEVDLSNQNTSQTRLIELVGWGKRVLEIGCWTGYMSKCMRERHCSVVGVEIDPAAAEQAREHLEKTIVGDVEQIDLDAELGEDRFDVVVLGDVLEHLRDPLSALIDLKRFLVPGGYVVASIPNVAHAAVKLALLDGHFEYQDTGLLDRTHVTLFTRESVEQLFREAGLVIVDLQRLTAGTFDTEVPLDRASVSDEHVRLAEAAPESTTYQFIVKAALHDGSRVVDELRQRQATIEQELASARRQFETLCEQIAGIVDDLGVAPRAADGPGSEEPAHPPVRVAVVGELDQGDFAPVLRARVVENELRRRFPVATVRLFAPGVKGSSSPFTTEGPIERLNPISDGERSALVSDYDCIVSVADLVLDDRMVAQRYGVEPMDFDGRSPTAYFTVGLGPDLEQRCPFVSSAVRVPAVRSPGEAESLWGAVGHRPYIAVRDEASAERLRDIGYRGDLQVVPDPLFLTPRLFSSAATADHLGVLRLRDWFPSHGAFLAVVGDLALLSQVGELAGQLRKAAEASSLHVLLLGLPGVPGSRECADALQSLVPGAFRAPSGVTVEDIVTIVARSQVLVSSLPEPLAVALAYGGFVVGLDGTGSTFDDLASLGGEVDVVVSRADGLAEALLRAQLRAPANEALARVRARLDTHFDRVADLAFQAAQQRAGGDRGADIGDMTRALATLRAYVQDLAHAFDRKGEQLASERALFGRRLQRLEGQLQERGDEVSRYGEQVQQLEAELATLRCEHDRVRLELEAVMNTRTWRYLEKPRRLYGLARKLLG